MNWAWFIILELRSFCRVRLAGALMSVTVAGVLLAQASFAAHAGSPTSSRSGATHSSTTVEIGDIGPESSVLLAPGDTLRILLGSNPSTGYHWDLRGYAPGTLSLEAAKALPSRSPAAGAPGRESFSFHALRVGQTKVILDYRRPWEKGVRPARSFEVTVRVVPTAESRKPRVIPSGWSIARYAGKLPCADCPGIHESLELYGAESGELAQGVYVETMEYEERPVAFVVAGQWRRSRGIAGDPHATVVSILANASGESRQYRVEDDSLEPLDSQGKPIVSPLNLKLHKVDSRE